MVEKTTEKEITDDEEEPETTITQENKHGPDREISVITRQEKPQHENISRKTRKSINI